MAGAFEARTVTRRRLMEGGAQLRAAWLWRRSHCRGARVRARAAVRADHPVGLAGRGHRGRLQRPDLRAARDQRGSRVGDAGKTTIYVRRLNEGRDREVPDQGPPPPYVAISTRCAHLGAVPLHPGFGQVRAPAGGVYGFEGQVEGGPPVRPLDRFYTRVVNGRVEIGDRFSLNSTCAASRTARPQPPRRALAVPLSREADHMKLPRPQGPAPRAKAPGHDRMEQRRRGPTKPTAKEHAVGAATAIGWLDERTGTTPSCAASSTARCQGHQLVLHAGLRHDVRLPLTGHHRRVPGDVLRARRHARLRVGLAHHNEVFLGELVRGMHKWGKLW